MIVMILFVVTVFTFAIASYIIYVLLKKKGARYIKLSKNGDYINISEIEVYAGGINIGRNSKVKMSSILNGINKYNVINGIVHGNFSHNSDAIIHTDDNDLKPTVELDLQDVYKIDKIIIYNRTDCCQNRLKNVKLEILDNNKKVLFNKILNSDDKQIILIE